MFASRLILLLAVGLLVFPLSFAEAQVPTDLELNSLGLSVSSPLLVRPAFDGSDRLFIGERNGALLVHRPGAGLAIFLDLTASVDPGGEGGLLGVAFHPSYTQNGYFYVSYTSPGTGGPMTLTTVVERFRVSGTDPDVADPLSGLEILTLAQPRWNHNGGDLHFGPDGYLYLGLGDGGGGAATVNSQDDTTLLGTMVRIDPCAAASCAVPYQVPATNPFVGGAGLDEIWASGLRNPYRFSFDRQTGDLLVADVGQSDREEINFQAASNAGGDNYGWPCREGNIAGTSSCSGSFVDPILVYSHSQGNCSVTGGYRYRGCIQGMRGLYVFGDYCTGKVFFGQEQSAGQWTLSEQFDLSGNILGFGEDEAGELYLLQSQQILRFESLSDCLAPVLFSDGFESGDLSAWGGA